jgi:hypothetical protein
MEKLTPPEGYVGDVSYEETKRPPPPEDWSGTL